MTRDCDPDALEALARGAAPADGAALDAHLAACDDCARELAWLRAERDLLRARTTEEPSLERLWDGVAARIAPATATAAPYRTPAPPPPRLPERRPWRAFAAGAAAATVAILGVAALTFRVKVTPSRVTATARHAAPSPASRAVEVPVAGTVTLRMETWSADVRAGAGRDGVIRVTLHGSDAEPQVARRPDGRYEVLFDGRRLGHGSVELELPRGSGVELVTASGDVTLAGLGASARVTTASGDVRASDVRGAEVSTSSGDVELASLAGGARVRTVSGSVRIAQPGDAQEVALETSSGDLEWSGACARGCRLGARSISGDVRLAFARESGFTLRFATVSGELSDALGTGAALPEGGGPAEGRYGDGAGSVEVSSTSGALAIVPRP